jgi:hypothetical protein
VLGRNEQTKSRPPPAIWQPHTQRQPCLADSTALLPAGLPWA